MGNEQSGNRRQPRLSTYSKSAQRKNFYQSQSQNHVKQDQEDFRSSQPSYPKNEVTAGGEDSDQEGQDLGGVTVEAPSPQDTNTPYIYQEIEEDSSAAQNEEEEKGEMSYPPMDYSNQMVA